MCVLVLVEEGLFLWGGVGYVVLFLLRSVFFFFFLWGRSRMCVLVFVEEGLFFLSWWGEVGCVFLFLLRSVFFWWGELDACSCSL